MKIDLAACLLALALLPAFHTPCAARESPVTWCFDGDTVKLGDRRVVRLAGIDAPETGKRGEKGQYYAREARKALEDLCRGIPVTVYPLGADGRDRYGRLVGELRLADGTSLNERMLEKGAAFFYPHRDLDPEYMERLKKIQDEAIRERRGLWAGLLESPAAQQNYVGNRSSLRFFPADCPQAQAIRARNRVYFGNLMDAFMAGFAPARVCPFWPQER